MPRKLTATTGVLLALVFAGCGSDNSSKTTSQSAAATTPVATTPATTTSAGKASKSKSSKTTTTSKKTGAATTSGSKKPSGIGTDSSGPTKEATKKKAATKKKKTTTTTSKKPVGVTPATGSGSGADTSSGTGSGPAADRLAVVSVLRKYYQAFIDSDGAEACAQLTREGQDILKTDGGGKTCAASVPNLVKRAGPDNVDRLSSTRDGLHINDITVTGNNATAQFGPASRLRLVQVDGRWYLRSPNVVNSNTG
ncbi:MAG TPA: hypothetical protein VL120_00685 [Solirubrobacteraceae bacterium]|nr:hypothetical protein [Solirubrobacteraceae bacterium]